MQVPKNIFRNYDIRGIYPDEFNEEIAFHLGRALGTRLYRKDKNKVVVGRDNRESSPALSSALVDGLVKTGCAVTDVGITMTPVIHFLSCTEDFDLGINVTASHNPKEFNGLRIDYKNARSFYGDLVLMLRFLLEREEYVYADGSYKQVDLNGNYVDFLKEKFKLKKNLKVVINCGHGATSELAPQLLSALGCQVIALNCRFDGSFPKGVPDPENEETVDEVRNYLQSHKADAGFVFDADGDRFGMVDENGEAYPTDKALLFFAQDVLKRNAGAKVVYDVKSSAMVEKYIKDFGGLPEIMRTGHPYFTDKVEHEAVLGAEFSGHVYFSDDYFGYDDGLYAACRVLDVMDRSEKPLSTMMANFPKTSSTNELKVPCPDGEKFKVVNLIKLHIMNKMKYKRIVDIDGVRVSVSETGWFLIRASNTSPYLSIRAEGKDDEEKELMLDKVREALESVEIVNLDAGF